jgi:hypothetical protein
VPCGHGDGTIGGDGTARHRVGPSEKYGAPEKIWRTGKMGPSEKWDRGETVGDKNSETSPHMRPLPR